MIETDPSAMEKYVNSQVSDKQIVDSLLADIRALKLKSLFHVKDEVVIREKQKVAEEHRKKSKKEKKKREGDGKGEKKG